MTTFSHKVNICFSISDRSGMAFPYNEMVREWNGAHWSSFLMNLKQPHLEFQTK